MSEGLYSMEERDFDTTLDLKKTKPYGDTMNDGKTQVSFTLPVPSGNEAIEAAKQLMRKMGFDNPQVVFYKELTKGFTFFNCYGDCVHTVDFTSIHVPKVESTTWDMHQTDEFVKENIGRKLVIVGASTGTDAHTVGIDAIMNMKGYAGHFGLERYEGFEAYNLGSQVPNDEFIAKAIELKADALLVSQTVTQKDVHIQNLVELVEMLEAEGLRSKVILCCGGPRLNHELAKELGYDAGFGMNTFADDVASFVVQEFVRRKKK
ncbi:MAG: OAM dimerization domain-containing protein [Bacteroidales bacterium]|nr:OAM dimerization domain-containing protein [Bacteroidales bacterium]MDD3891563.1 OAM dimerization domain-containing protein [Bacteroidales bacterium]